MVGFDLLNGILLIMHSGMIPTDKQGGLLRLLNYDPYLYLII